MHAHILCLYTPSTPAVGLNAKPFFSESSRVAYQINRKWSISSVCALMLDESTDITVDKNCLFVCDIWKMVDQKPGSYQFFVDKWEG